MVRRAAGLVLMALLAASTVQAQERPNIIVILSDDHRWDGMGAAGNPNIVTPSLDRLARDGVHFRQAIAHVPQCTPNRAVMLTGLPSHRTGWYSNQAQRPEAQGPDGLGRFPLLPKLLQAAGYHTALVGKWHLPQRPWLTGFSEVRTWMPGGGGPYLDPELARGATRDVAPAKGFTQEIFADDAIAYVNEAAGKSQPFFLWLAFTAPHAPFQPNPDRIAKLYAGKPAASLPPPGFRGEPPLANWTTYYEAISSLDEQIGRVLQALDDRKIAQRTIVVFMGDNGFMMRSRGWTGKVLPYEESLRVPLMIRAPMLAKFKGVTDAVASSLDIPASVARWAGASVPAEWPGRDLTAALRSNDDHRLPHAVAEFSDATSEQFGQYAYRAIRTPTAKLIRWQSKDKKDELYDLSTDPHEATNRIDDPALTRTAATLRAELEAWVKRTGDAFPRGTK